MTSSNKESAPPKRILPKSERQALWAVGIVFIILLAFHNFVINHVDNTSLYNLSLGILSWASIQSGSLLAIHLYVRNDFMRLEESKKKTPLKFLYENNKQPFRDYTNSLFRGWVISLVLAMVALIFIVLRPNVSLCWVYLAGTFMFSLFVGLLFLLYFSLTTYHTISSLNRYISNSK